VEDLADLERRGLIRPIAESAMLVATNVRNALLPLGLAFVEFVAAEAAASSRSHNRRRRRVGATPLQAEKPGETPMRVTFAYDGRGPGLHCENLGELRTSVNAIGYYDAAGRDGVLGCEDALPVPIEARTEVMLHFKKDSLARAAYWERQQGGALTGFWAREIGDKYRKARIDSRVLEVINATANPD
jgi:hypothetical protein